MYRRALIAVLAQGVIAFPSLTQAQAAKTRRIGYLSLAQGGSEPAPAALRDLGWLEGQNLIVDRRFAAGRVELLQPMVEELVRLRVDVIFANGTVASLAAKRATTSIPIIIDRSADPVGAGLVASLARPGANITGISTLAAELQVKKVQLLRELLPGATIFGVLVNPENPVDRSTRKNMEQAVRLLQIALVFVEVSAASELQIAVAKVAQEGAQGLIINADPLFVTNFPVIASAAQSYRIPMMIELPSWLSICGLLSYGLNWTQYERQLARIIDKVLRGARPADLPIEQPTKFDLVINLKSARALGITVPRSLLLRADEVIE